MIRISTGLAKELLASGVRMTEIQRGALQDLIEARAEIERTRQDLTQLIKTLPRE